MTNSILTQEELKELLNYDAETGIFTWKVKRKAKQNIGDVAGNLAHYHIQIMINSKSYMAHRLAWFYVYGEWPKCQIDHINRIKTDNRIINLRDVNHAENMQNIHGPQKNNTTGYRGTYYFKRMKKYGARIVANGKIYFLGYYSSAKEAGDAYIKAKAELHISGSI